MAISNDERFGKALDLLKVGLAARGRSTFSELRRYAPVAAAMATLAPTFWAERPESVRTGP